MLGYQAAQCIAGTAFQISSHWPQQSHSSRLSPAKAAPPSAQLNARAPCRHAALLLGGCRCIPGHGALASVGELRLGLAPGSRQRAEQHEGADYLLCCCHARMCDSGSCRSGACSAAACLRLMPLVLQDNRLEGTLPPSWGSGGGFTKLVEVGLYYNSLRGKQPACRPAEHKEWLREGAVVAAVLATSPALELPLQAACPLLGTLGAPKAAALAQSPWKGWKCLAIGSQVRLAALLAAKVSCLHGVGGADRQADATCAGAEGALWAFNCVCRIGAFKLADAHHSDDTVSGGLVVVGGCAERWQTDGMSAAPLPPHLPPAPAVHVHMFRHACLHAGRYCLSGTTPFAGTRPSTAPPMSQL